MASTRPPVIAITTDFGLTDSYAGVIKGALLSICPRATIIDITHLVPPRDISAGAFILRQAAPFFPPETIHLAVVDPGVGTTRRLLAVSCKLGTFVGPDNGLFTGVLPADSSGVLAVRLTQSQFWLPSISPTFHGRDILAPVAAHLAAGAGLTDLGEPIPAESLVRLPWPMPVRNGTRITGEVIHVDHFGNLVTNVERPAGSGGDSITVRLDDREVGRLAAAYADRAPGQPVAYVGSSGFLEIAVVNQNAAECLSAERGSQVTVTLFEG